MIPNIPERISELWNMLDNNRLEISFQHEHGILTDAEFLKRLEQVNKEKKQVRDIVSNDFPLE